MFCAPQDKTFSKSLYDGPHRPLSRARIGEMTDVYRESRLRRRIRYIIHPRDTKDKRVLCYNPLLYVINTIQISCTEHC